MTITTTATGLLLGGCAGYSVYTTARNVYSHLSEERCLNAAMILAAAATAVAAYNAKCNSVGPDTMPTLEITIMPVIITPPPSTDPSSQLATFALVTLVVATIRLTFPATLRSHIQQGRAVEIGNPPRRCILNLDSRIQR